jgi:hypothetical protein
MRRVFGGRPAQRTAMSTSELDLEKDLQICESGEESEKAPRGLWAGNQMGNPNL